MRHCYTAAVRRPSVRRPVFVTETWRVIIPLVDFAGRDQHPPTARDIYRRRRSTVSLYTQWQCVRSVICFLTVWFSSSVKLHHCGRRTISWKLLAIGFAATMRLLSNYFDLMLHYALDITKRNVLSPTTLCSSPHSYITARTRMYM